jgi:hypothetical protein
MIDAVSNDPNVSTRISRKLIARRHIEGDHTTPQRSELGTESKIDELRGLGENFERSLLLIANGPVTDAPIDPLKLESIRIEGQIQQVIEDLKICIRQDYSIGSERHDSYLSSVLSQLGLDPDELAAGRLSTVRAAHIAVAEQKRLLGDDADVELRRATGLRAKWTAAIASDITARLIQKRDLIAEQVRESERSLELMQESTAELIGVSDAVGQVGTAQWHLVADHQIARSAEIGQMAPQVLALVLHHRAVLPDSQEPSFQ